MKVVALAPFSIRRLLPTGELLQRIREWLHGSSRELPRSGTPEDAISEALSLQVRQLEMKIDGLVDSLFSGEYLSVFRGRGLEFSQLREYERGDDVRAIDWKVTARRGHPYIKQFLEERELTTLVVIDVSASKGFGTAEKSNAELAFELAGILALAAIRNNDRVGLVLVSDEVELFLAPSGGRRHALRFLLELHAFEPKRRATRPSAALDFIGRISPQRAIIFLISDFIVEEDEVEALLHASRAIKARHDLIPIRILDPTTESLPDIGVVALVDPETGKRVVVNTADPDFRESYRAATRVARDRIAAVFRQAGVEMLEVTATESYVPPLLRFFHHRRRGSVRP